MTTNTPAVAAAYDAWTVDSSFDGTFADYLAAYNRVATAATSLGDPGTPGRRYAPVGASLGDPGTPGRRY